MLSSKAFSLKNPMATRPARRPKNVYVTLIVSPSPSVSDSSDAEDIFKVSRLHQEGSYEVPESHQGVIFDKIQGGIKDVLAGTEFFERMLDAFRW
jgi:hypothetical protein